MSLSEKTHSVTARAPHRLEWPTLLVAALCYAVWAAASVWPAGAGTVPAAVALAAAIALHSSLQHEVVHGHPFGNQTLSDLIVFPAVGLYIPLGRFRTLHLAHHHDPTLTDPHDDPESNYLDPEKWERLSPASRLVLRFNNTLLGRMLIGPALSLMIMYRDDIRRVVRGDRAILRDYLLHLAGLLPVIWWLSTIATIPPGAYFAAAYGGLSIVKIRTFLEHRAHQRAAARSVVIEDRGIFAFLFLNNNFHAVHHAHPNTPWYRLPAEYRRRREEFLRRNGGYRYRSYYDVFKQYFLAAKDPVPHPLWRGRVAHGIREATGKDEERAAL
ncbi:MAG: fatty acid desaturase [Paracoccaceae bacterium]